MGEGVGVGVGVVRRATSSAAENISQLSNVGTKAGKLNTTQSATETAAIDTNEPKSEKMSSGTFVDRIDPFAKRSLKKKSKKSQGSSRYRNSTDVELQQLPPLKGD